MESAEPGLAARIPGLSLESLGEEDVAPPGPASSPTAGRRRLDSFDIVCLIGKGGFGKVFLVRHRATNAVYAMKVMEKDNLIERRAVRDAHAERNILAMVGSNLGDSAPFIVRLHVAFQTSKRVYLVMDFASGGELMYHLRHEAMLSETATKFYAAELLLALEALHNMDVVHRDIKPENLLLDGDGHLVLTDFGLAKDLRGLLDQQHSWCGSEDYMAPETLAREPHTGKPADYWAFGVFLFDCLVGEPPFSPLREKGRTTRKKLHDRILKCKFKLPTWLSRECHSLIRALITRDPEKRLTDPAAIRAHPWFKGVDWDAVRAKELVPPIIPNVGDDGAGVGCFSPSLTQANISIHSPAPISIPGRRVSARGATPASSPGLHSHPSAAPHVDDTIWGGFSFVAPGMEVHFAMAAPPVSAAPSPVADINFSTPALTPSLHTHTLAAERAEFSVDAAEAVEILDDKVKLPSHVNTPIKQTSISPFSSATPAHAQPALVHAAATQARENVAAAASDGAQQSTGGKQRKRRQRKKLQRMQQAAQKNPQAPQIKPPHQLKLPQNST